jgi:hypothetical protein
MPQTPRLALPLIAAGQAQKDVTHNEALLALDRLVALVVVSDSEPAPPAAPAEGSVWIVPAAGAAAWGETAGTLMFRQDAAWIAVPPRDGQTAFVASNGQLLVHASGWQMVRSIGPAIPVALPNGGSVIDSEARTALAALVGVLQQHGIVIQGS